MKFLGTDPETGRQNIEWCCEEAHQAYLSDTIGYEDSEDSFCIYSIPPGARRTKKYDPRHFAKPIKFCPLCGEPAVSED